MFQVVRPDGLVVHQGKRDDCQQYVANVRTVWGIRNLRITKKGSK
jgi:hypothetical protein